MFWHNAIETLEKNGAQIAELYSAEEAPCVWSWASRLLKDTSLAPFTRKQNTQISSFSVIKLYRMRAKELKTSDTLAW